MHLTSESKIGSEEAFLISKLDESRIILSKDHQKPCHLNSENKRQTLRPEAIIMDSGWIQVIY